MLAGPSSDTAWATAGGGMLFGEEGESKDL